MTPDAVNTEKIVSFLSLICPSVRKPSLNFRHFIKITLFYVSHLKICKNKTISSNQNQEKTKKFFAHQRKQEAFSDSAATNSQVTKIEELLG